MVWRKPMLVLSMTAKAIYGEPQACYLDVTSNVRRLADACELA
jgi:hypothetical protein